MYLVKYDARRTWKALGALLKNVVCSVRMVPYKLHLHLFMVWGRGEKSLAMDFVVASCVLSLSLHPLFPFIPWIA